MFVRSKNDKNIEPLLSGNDIIYELIGPQVGGSKNYSLAQVELLPGKCSLRHFHPSSEESYYILYGTAKMVINNEKKVVEAGQIVVIPPKAVHQICNDSDAPVHYLAFCMPAWCPEESVIAEQCVLETVK